jgi:hypothetical protein
MDIKHQANDCLIYNETNADDETLNMHLLIQNGERQPVIHEYTGRDGSKWYFKVEGHYAQAIYLKASLNKTNWTTIYSASDH